MGKENRNRSRKRKAAPVRAPFPWGAALGVSILGVAVVGVLVYAFLNAGSAAPSPLRDADESVEGVAVAEVPPSQDHQAGPLQYDRSPSWGGAHNQVWTTCSGTVYPEQVPDENATHSLEHGAVWVSYRPDLPATEVGALENLVENRDYRFIAPYPELDTAVSLQAWGRQLKVDSVDDPRIDNFLQQYTNGPQAAEPGATCSSGTQATGIEPASS